MESLTLPMDAALLVPHRPPVRLIDRLLSFDLNSGVVEACLSDESPFLEGQDIDAPLLLELMAQACAAMKGYSDLRAGNPIKKGYLVAIKRARFERRAGAGERLLIKVHMGPSFGGFNMAEAEVEGDKGPVATGEIKLWVPDEGTVAGLMSST